jgi:hypothetical protein
MRNRIRILLRVLAAVLLVFSSLGLDEPGGHDGSAAEGQRYAR